MELANGKVVLLRDAWYAGEGNVGTEEANIQVRFEGLSGEEIKVMEGTVIKLSKPISAHGETIAQLSLK